MEGTLPKPVPTWDVALVLFSKFRSKYIELLTNVDWEKIPNEMKKAFQLMIEKMKNEI